MIGTLIVPNGVPARVKYNCSILERLDTLIAPGTYKLALTASPKFTRAARIKALRAGASQGAVNAIVVKTPEILGVTGRSGLRIHVGNRVDQLRGCLAPGQRFIQTGNAINIAESTAAYDMLLDCLWPEGSEAVVHTITIRGPR